MASSRNTVMALAGVASADGSNFPGSGATTPPHGQRPTGLEVGPVGAGDHARRPKLRPASSAGSRMIPSISGASRWLRATPGESTSTRTVRPTSAGAAAR